MFGVHLDVISPLWVMFFAFSEKESISVFQITSVFTDYSHLVNRY